MKIRSGFVSNSSTCSFLAIGVKMSHDEINQRGLGDEQENVIWIDHESCYVVGKIFCDSDCDEGIDDITIGIDDFCDIAKEITRQYDVPLEKVSLIAGTHSC